MRSQIFIYIKSEFILNDDGETKLWHRIHKTSSTTIYESHYESVRLWPVSFCISFMWVCLCCARASEYRYNPYIVAYHIQCYCGIMKMDGWCDWYSVGERNTLHDILCLSSSFAAPLLSLPLIFLIHFWCVHECWPIYCAIFDFAFSQSSCVYLCIFGLVLCCVLPVSAFIPAPFTYRT